MQVVAPVVVHVPPAGLEVTVYPVMAEPPVGGAVQDRLAVVVDVVAEAVTARGAPGTLAFSELEADDATLVPAELVAVTVNVYAVPVVRPVTVQPVVALLQVRLPGVEVTL